MNIEKKPYEFVCKHYEKKFPFVGGKVFSILALAPLSLIIPPIPSENKTIERTLSTLIISPPGSGKTSLSQAFEEITLNPLSTHKITPARLVDKIREEEYKHFSLIISDLAMSFTSEEFVKTVEQIIEEGNVDRHTVKDKKNDERRKIKAIAYLSGTPRSLSDGKVRDGILGRTFPIVHYIEQKDMYHILDNLNGKIGKKHSEDETHKIIEFYQKILKLQLEELHIEGYIFSEKIIKELGEFVRNNECLRLILQKWNISYVRQWEEAYVIMVCNAFLNILNRETLNKKIVITEEDLEVAKDLVARGAVNSYRIYEAISKIDWYNIRNEKTLVDFFKCKKNIPPESKFIMQGMVKK